MTTYDLIACGLQIPVQKRKTQVGVHAHYSATEWYAIAYDRAKWFDRETVDVAPRIALTDRRTVQDL